MKALLKGKLSISYTAWNQDTVGGRTETIVPVCNDIPFVAKETRDPAIVELPGKSGFDRAYRIWFDTAKTNLLDYNLEEYGYCHFQGSEQCYKIVSVQLVNSQSGRRGWEIVVSRRV